MATWKLCNMKNEDPSFKTANTAAAGLAIHYGRGVGKSSKIRKKNDLIFFILLKGTLKNIWKVEQKTFANFLQFCSIVEKSFNYLGTYMWCAHSQCCEV